MHSVCDYVSRPLSHWEDSNYNWKDGRDGTAGDISTSPQASSDPGAPSVSSSVAAEGAFFRWSAGTSFSSPITPD